MKVLILSPYFTPCTSVAVLRMTSLAAYLQKLGDKVTVIKLADVCYGTNMSKGTPLPGITYVEFTPHMDGGRPEESLYPLLDRLCRENSFDCCIVSFGPFYTIKPAIYLKERYAIPLIADYRDLWIYYVPTVSTFRSFLGRQKCRLLYGKVESQLMRRCTFFVTCTPRCLQIMQNHYPFLQKKSALVYNGYGFSPNMSPPPSTSRNGVADLFILGKYSYYISEGAEALFRAAAAQIKKGHLIHIYHVGMMEDVRQIMEKEAFPQECFHELGPLPYETALSAAVSARICFLIYNQDAGIGTKIFDYIYLNKPIIAYAPKQSEIEDLLSDAENAYVCQNASQIEAAIETIFANEQYELTANPFFRQRFSRETQNERFRKLLVAAANGNPVPPELQEK